MQPWLSPHSPCCLACMRHSVHVCFVLTGVYANGGPTNIDPINCLAAGQLALQMDRTSADKRGVKMEYKTGAV